MNKLTAVAFTVAAATSCSIFTVDFDSVIGIEVDEQDVTVTVGDTARLVARAVNGKGEVVPDAAIFWAILDSGQVGFTLDTVGGLITGIEVGSGRVQARVDDIRSEPLVVTVVAPPAFTAARRPRGAHRLATKPR